MIMAWTCPLVRFLLFPHFQYPDTISWNDDAEYILSADQLGVGKPDLRPYKWAMEKIGKKPGDLFVFAAGHAWDTSAAKCVIFIRHDLPLDADVRTCSAGWLE